MKVPRVFDLEDRLVDFAVRVVRLTEGLPEGRAANHIRNQRLRCGTSPAPNYGEAQSAESRADFIHKIKIVLKELRETRVWLLMLARADLGAPMQVVAETTEECGELIAIFAKCEQTARKNSA